MEHWNYPEPQTKWVWGVRWGREQTENKMVWKRPTFPKAAPLPTHPTISHHWFYFQPIHLPSTSSVGREGIFSVNKINWISCPTCWERIRTLGKCLNFRFLFCKMGIMKSVSKDHENQNTVMCKALCRSYLWCTQCTVLTEEGGGQLEGKKPL